jgi:hypothetical protein
MGAHSNKKIFVTTEEAEAFRQGIQFALAYFSSDEIDAEKPVYEEDGTVSVFIQTDDGCC